MTEVKAPVVEEIKPIRKGLAMHDDFREMAKVVTIDTITPIKKADRLELATVGGWTVIVKKGEFTQGQKVIYCEIDAMLPITYPDFKFLGDRRDNLRDVDGVLYARLKTMRMRGELSQGLIVPLPENIAEIEVDTAKKLGVLKYVDPKEIGAREGIDAILDTKDRSSLSFMTRVGIWIAGKAAPNNLLPFPSFLAKSEQPRVQNISAAYGQAVLDGEKFERTLKVDGSSCTYYTLKGASNEIQSGVAQRNFEISPEDLVFTWEQAIRRWIATLIFKNRYMFRLGMPELRDPKQMDAAPEYIQNPQPGFMAKLKRGLWHLSHIRPTVSVYIPQFIKVLRPTDNPYYAFGVNHYILDKLVQHARETGEFLTVQGELAGPGIDDNAEGLEEQRFFVYSVYRNGRQELLPEEARQKAAMLGLEYVPVIAEEMTLPLTMKQVVQLADGPGHFDATRSREGDVYKSTTRNFSFKVISAGFLLQEAAKDDDAHNS
jgi:hypothetical protein